MMDLTRVTGSEAGSCEAELFNGLGMRMVRRPRLLVRHTLAADAHNVGGTILMPVLWQCGGHFITNDCCCCCCCVQGVVTGVVQGSPDASAPAANIMNSSLYKLALGECWQAKYYVDESICAPRKCVA
jgi:hypothetical protein